MNERSAELNQLVMSYMFLRKAVGWIGSLLPVVLLVGNAAVFAAARPESMSGYYYTHMRNVFVGALCALGVFLVAYDGYDDIERWVTNIAGTGALGVAFFPTKPPVCPASATATCPAYSVVRLSASQQVVGDIHLAFAAVTFIALAFMAFRFAKPERNARARDRVIYLGCGSGILACVVLAAAANLLPASVNADWSPLFIFEALAVFLFGLSWFVKGDTMLGVLSWVRRGLPRTGPARR